MTLTVALTTGQHYRAACDLTFYLSHVRFRIYSLGLLQIELLVINMRSLHINTSASVTVTVTDQLVRVPMFGSGTVYGTV